MAMSSCLSTHSEGREVVLDTKNRYWCYAQLDGNGRSFISTGVPVITASPGSFVANRAQVLASGATAPNQILPVDVVLARVRAAQAEHRVDEKGRPLAPTRDGQASAGQEEPPLPAPPERTTVGDYVGLCILVDFTDQPGTITPTQVDNHCNQPSGYTEFGNACFG